MEDKTPLIRKEDFVIADKQKHTAEETTSKKEVKSSSKYSNVLSKTHLH